MPEGPFQGVFVSFEGGEGCGKSTQIERLAALCKIAGVPAIVLREPGGTPVGEQIRHLLKFAPEARDLTAESELLLFAASRAQLVRQRVLPALESGALVISDRYTDSTTVYQGAGRNLDPTALTAINQFATGGLMPDLTFLLDMPPAEARIRLLRRPRPVNSPVDRMESEPLEFHERVRAAYLALAEGDPLRFLVLDATKSPDILAEDILEALRSRFPSLLQLLPANR